MQSAFLFTQWFITNHSNDSTLISKLNPDLWTQFIQSESASKSLVDNIIPKLIQKNTDTLVKKPRVIKKTRVDNASQTIHYDITAVVEDVPLVKEDKKTKTKKSKTSKIIPAVDSSTVEDGPLVKENKKHKTKKSKTSEIIPAVDSSVVEDVPLVKEDKKTKTKKSKTSDVIPAVDSSTVEDVPLVKEDKKTKPKKSKTSDVIPAVDSSAVVVEDTPKTDERVEVVVPMDTYDLDLSHESYHQSEIVLTSFYDPEGNIYYQDEHGLTTTIR
jgi:hypothetical protein